MGKRPDVPGLSDPLAAIVDIVNANRHSPEAKTLAAAMVAIWLKRGDLPETAVYNLDQRSSALLVVLMEGRVHRKYSDAQWLAALEKMAAE